MTFEVPAWYAALDELVPVGGGAHVAFIRRSDVGTELHANVQAAVVVAFARLRSVDDVRARYMDGEAITGGMDDIADLDALCDSYRLAADSMEAARTRLNPDGRPDPTLGVFAAEIALSRLSASFKSAHLLYRLGHVTDGHAIMRVILEQIAWAYVAGGLQDEAELAALQPTKMISRLKDLYPGAGRIYGVLNSKTHLEIGEHRRRVERGRDQLRIVQTEPAALEGSSVLLVLCDIWLAVWEATQADFLDAFEHILVDEDGVRPHPDRAFKRAMFEQIDAVEVAVRQVQ